MLYTCVHGHFYVRVEQMQQQLSAQLYAPTHLHLSGTYFANAVCICILKHRQLIMDHYMGFRAFRDLWIVGWGFCCVSFCFDGQGLWHHKADIKQTIQCLNKSLYSAIINSFFQFNQVFIAKKESVRPVDQIQENFSTPEKFVYLVIFHVSRQSISLKLSLSAYYLYHIGKQLLQFKPQGSTPYFDLECSMNGASKNKFCPHKGRISLWRPLLFFSTYF